MCRRVKTSSHLNTDVRPGEILFHGLLDSDGDGISDVEEDEGPGGGDGNADGVADSTQPRIASFRSLQNNAYVTLETDAGRLTGITSIAEQEFPATVPNTIFASGLFEFEIVDLTAGEIATIDVLLHSGEDTTGLFYLSTPSGQPPELSVFERDTQSGTGIQSLDVGKVTARFSDGGEADLDDVADGTLRVIAGSGLADGVVATNPINPFDVNNDGDVSALDALKVINVLARIQDGRSGVKLASSDSFFDVNRSGDVTALDALNVINQLAREQAGAGEGEQRFDRREQGVDAVMAGFVTPHEEDEDPEWVESIANLF